MVTVLETTFKRNFIIIIVIVDKATQS